MHGSVRTVSVVERALDPEVKRRGSSLLSDFERFLAPTGLGCYLYKMRRWDQKIKAPFCSDCLGFSQQHLVNSE